MRSAAEVARLKRILWPEGTEDLPSKIFAVLDGARSPEIWQRLSQGKVESHCLFRGELSPALARAAPYLVYLPSWTDFTNWLLAEGWGKNWGIFLYAGADPEALRRHFRRFLRVQDEDRRTLYFRFYDPRVWRVYLPTCDEFETEYVFGPVRQYFVEEADPTRLRVFEREKSRLRISEVSLHDNSVTTVSGADARS
jgi:hypothetical protein